MSTSHFSNYHPFITPKIPTIAAPPPWRGSAALSSSNAYETPTSSADEYSSLEPYSFYDTAYPVPSVSSPTPHPQYSAIVTVRTSTWVLSRSTTITSIILETYYSTLTDIESPVEAATVTETTSTECTTASGYASVYASGCSSSSSSSSTSSSSSKNMVTVTWSPEVTAYPLPSTDKGKSPASTSGSTTTTTTTETASSGKETPPVVTGGARSAPQAAQLRTFGVVAALLAMLL
ncbi:uncharacterized protein TrAtP1_010739 [Trichoderma atroviride]|uniref:uncharacterized protein n=1 Tax=Hypocrea atroviridis TaxID=63577 RepID=UPI00332E8E99|nr:hypothetical protein TrAtP1_010739 [Trichoderma atroviride]